MSNALATLLQLCACAVPYLAFRWGQSTARKLNYEKVWLSGRKNGLEHALNVLERSARDVEMSVKAGDLVFDQYGIYHVTVSFEPAPAQQVKDLVARAIETGDWT